MTTQHIMVDWETLGLHGNAVLLALGAVKFNPTVGTVEGTYYQVIEAKSCEDIGMTASSSTALWWMGQTEASKEILEAHNLKERFDNDDTFEPEQGQMVAMPLNLVMAGFNNWVGMDGEGNMPETTLWASARKDYEWMDNAYEKLGFRKPYTYRGEMCFRTLRKLFPSVEHVWEGTAHNAVDDATNQALHLCKIMRHLESLRAVGETVFTLEEAAVGTDYGVSPGLFENAMSDFLLKRKARLEL